jgi:hypothetical protein
LVLELIPQIEHFLIVGCPLHEIRIPNRVAIGFSSFGPRLIYIISANSGQEKPGTWPGFQFPGSGGLLCTLAMSPEPLAVLDVPLIAA